MAVNGYQKLVLRKMKMKFLENLLKFTEDLMMELKYLK